MKTDKFLKNFYIFFRIAFEQQQMGFLNLICGGCGVARTPRPHRVSGGPARFIRSLTAVRRTGHSFDRRSAMGKIAFEKIAAGMEEAIASASGKTDGARVNVPKRSRLAKKAKQMTDECTAKL
jgi:hypothetical protein